MYLHQWNYMLGSWAEKSRELVINNLCQVPPHHTSLLRPSWRSWTILRWCCMRFVPKENAFSVCMRWSKNPQTIPDGRFSKWIANGFAIDLPYMRRIERCVMPLNGRNSWAESHVRDCLILNLVEARHSGISNFRPDQVRYSDHYSIFWAQPRESSTGLSTCLLKTA